MTTTDVPTKLIRLALAVLPLALASPAVADDAAAAADEPAVTSRYPRAVIARPLTLPRSVAVLGADVGANHDFTTMGGTPIAGYGFTDAFEVQIPYAFTARELEPRGSVNVDAGYMVLRGAVGGALEAIARVRTGYSLLDKAATPLMIGLHVQYNFTDKLAVISGTPGSQQLRISLANDTTGAMPVDLSLPVGVGFQASNELYVQLDTKLLQLGIHDSSTQLVGKDTTPMTLTVVYNLLHAFDIQAAISSDLMNQPGDALTFLVGARYYAGDL